MHQVAVHLLRILEVTCIVERMHHESQRCVGASDCCRLLQVKFRLLHHIEVHLLRILQVPCIELEAHQTRGVPGWFSPVNSMGCLIAVPMAGVLQWASSCSCCS
jgi:hypothetical protein